MDKYVVLPGRLGERWVRGDVIDGSELGAKETVERLLAKEAIRPATEAEAGCQRVDLPGHQLPPASVQDALVAKEREIDRLRKEVSRLERELLDEQNRKTPAAAPVPVSSEPVAKLLHEKDVTIKGLQTQLKAKAGK